MPTSPSNHVCTKLELWKLVLKKYFSYYVYVLRALVVGTPNLFTLFVLPCAQFCRYNIYLYLSL
jgi:hypothetical protein